MEEKTIDENKIEVDEEEDDIASALCRENSIEIISSDVWNLVPKIVSQVSREHLQQDRKSCKQKVSVLNRVASVANAKEFLLIVLAQLEENFDDIRFCFLLTPLQTSLLRLSDKEGKSLQWCLNCIYDCLGKIDVPEDYELEGEEKLFLDNDDNYTTICSVYEGLIEFYQLYLMEVLNLQKEGQSAEKSLLVKNIFTKHLFKIFEKPVLHLDLEVRKVEVPKSRIRNAVENLMTMLFSVCDNVLSYFEFIDSPINNFQVPAEDDSHFIPTLSAANFYYLLFQEKIGYAEKVPKVYNSAYVRFNLLPLATALIKQEESLIRRKGLLLSNFMFSELECNFHSEAIYIEPFMQSLLASITYEKTEENRKLSLEVFQNYFRKLSVKEKYLVFLRIQPMISNSSLKAFVITSIKDTLIKNYQHPLFSHKYLLDLICLYCKLRDGPTTDVMEFASEIIGALNFVRFLIIRDKKNELGTLNFVDRIDEILLSPLSEAIKMSVAHWELKLKEITNDEVPSVDSKNVSLTVSGQKLPTLPKEEQIKIVHSAFNCMDLLASLLGRVKECVRDISCNLH